MTKSLARQCEDAVDAMKNIFAASRYVGPRPDCVLRAMVRISLAQYRESSDSLREAIGVSLDFRSQATHRSACWEDCVAERRRLLRLQLNARREEIAGKAVTVGMQKRDQELLDVLVKELEALAQPLPDSVT